MIRKEEVKMWSQKYHNKFDLLHEIELFIMSQAVQGKYQAVYPIGKDLIDRWSRGALTNTDIRVLYQLKANGYECDFTLDGLLINWGF